MSDEKQREDLSWVSTLELSDEDVVDRINMDLKAGRQAKADSFIRNKRYMKIYEALDPAELMLTQDSGDISEDRPIHSNTYLAVGAAAVDTASVQLFNQLFSTPDYFELVADDFMDSVSMPQITAHIKKRHKEMRFKTTVLRLLQQSLCFDYSVSFVRWKIRPGYQNKLQTTISNKKIGGVDLPYQDVKMESVWVPNAIDRSDVQIIDYFNCVHDDWAGNGNLDDSTFFIDWRYEPIAELEFLSQSKDRPWAKYKNIDKAIDEHNILMSTRSKDVYDPIDRDQHTQSKRIKVIRYWTQDEIIETAHDIVISREKIDGLPLQLWKTYELANRFQGMGILQRIERNQYDINAIINIKRDFQNLSLTPITAISDKVMGLEEGDVALYSGRTFRTRGNPKDSIVFYQPGFDTSQGATEELQLQMESIERVTGFGGENIQGAFASGRKTAREVNAVMAGILTKVTQIAAKHEENCLEEIYFRQFILEQTHLSTEDSFHYNGSDGEGWMIIRPEDYRWRRMPRFEAKGSSNATDKQLHMQQFMKAMEVAQQFPKMHNWEKILAKMWQMLDPKDWQHFMSDPRNKGHNVPPNIENLMLSQGSQVEVSPENDHQIHMQVHSAIEQTPDFQIWPQSFKMNLQRHKMEHQNGMVQPSAGPRLGETVGQDSSDQMRGLRLE